MNRDRARDGADLRGPGHVVPVVGLEEVIDGVRGPHVLTGAARPPDFERHRSARRPAAGPESGEIPPVVRVQVADEDLRQEVHRDHHRGDIGHRARTDVEQELVPVPKLEQKAARSLSTTSSGQARSACRDSDLIRFECLGTRVVDIAVRCCTGRRSDLSSSAEQYDH